MVHRKINVTVVDVSSSRISRDAPTNRMVSRWGDRHQAATAFRFVRRQGANRDSLVPGADPYIAQLVDRLSRQMAAQEKSRSDHHCDDSLRNEASPPLGDSGEYYGDPHRENRFTSPEEEPPE